MVRHHEFWNTHVFHFPVYLYWLYLSCKARSLFFFSAANPGIETGGLLGESKYKILQKINPKYLPLTIYFEKEATTQEVIARCEQSSLSFPFIVKPDMGQGGWLVDLIRDESELQRFLMRIKMPFVAQEYINEPMEVGLLYYRLPGEQNGVISSLSVKEMLTVVGDGHRTIAQLMRASPRASKQYHRLLSAGIVDLSSVPNPGCAVSLSFIGNHSYGTTFRNSNHLISDKLTARFDDLCKTIDGFYFGRFDIKCKSISSLEAGDFKVLELNGVGSEPLHIFDPSEKLWSAYKSAFHHWDIIYKISIMNKRRNKFMSLQEAAAMYRNFIRMQRIHQVNIRIGN